MSSDSVKVKDSNYTKIPNDIIDYAARAFRNQHAAAVLILIMRHDFKRDGSPVFLSNTSFAAKLNLNVSTVKRAMKVLSDAGVLYRTRRFSSSSMTYLDYCYLADKIAETKARCLLEENKLEYLKKSQSAPTEPTVSSG